MKHPNEEALWEHAVAGVAGEEPPRPEVIRHLDECEACERTVARFERLGRSLRAGELPSAPPEWIERAAELAAGPGLIDRAREAAAGIREVVASLVSDSMMTPALGVRGASSALARTQFFESELGEVYVQLSPGKANSISVRGQFVTAGTRNPDRAVAELVQGDRRRSCNLANVGEFTFNSVRSAPFALRISFDDVVLLIEPHHDIETE